jgi:hypothetical protein
MRELMDKLHHFKNAIVIAVIFAISGCGGSNTYTPLQSYEPADEAARLLEKGKPQEAITVLEDALKEEPENYRWISMLALAYAQRAGVAPIDFVEELGTSAASGESSANGITSLFGVTPPATRQNIADVDYAISLMTQLPADQLTDAEKLKLSIFQTASTVLKIKALDTNGDGAVSTAELLDLGLDTAESILTGLITASGLLAGGGSNASSGGDAAASQIEAMVSGINGQPGSNAKDKLASYLGT